jgi:hypothetical protein
MAKAKSTASGAHMFMFVKPKGLKKHPKQPKKTASLLVWEKWKAGCDMVDQHNAPILKRYKELDNQIKARKGL